MIQFRSQFFFVIAITFAIAASGCNNTTSPGSTGTIAGRVALFDSTGVALTDFSGTTVQVDNTALITITDSIGNWQFSGLSQGRYDITASKSGFGTFHWYEQEVIGGRLDLPTSAIAQMKNIAPILTEAGFTGGVLGFGGSNPGASQGTTVVAYCDLDSAAQPSDPHLATSYVDQYISINDLRAAGARSGQTLYISMSEAFDRGNLYSDGYASSFYDPVHHETRWSSPGPKSSVIAVTMP